ncbi:MAG TPA: PilZ domain-containing protein [Clostridia bacterium]|nr:PilZ domain-containing protein [Clostridia bacterium]
MSLTQQEELLLSIYSVDHLLKCRVMETTASTVQLAPVSGKIDMFQVYDPVVLIFFDQEKQLQTIPADVSQLDRSLASVTFLVREKEIAEERRVFERYPVSLEVSARRKFSSKRLRFVVKNLSLYGMGAVSQSDLEVDEPIDMDLITERSMFYFNGKVIWKKNLGKFFEYGLQYTLYDVATRSLLEDYLLRQKNDYIKMMSKAR